MSSLRHLNFAQFERKTFFDIRFEPIYLWFSVMFRWCDDSTCAIYHPYWYRQAFPGTLTLASYLREWVDFFWKTQSTKWRYLLKHGGPVLSIRIEFESFRKAYNKNQSPSELCTNGLKPKAFQDVFLSPPPHCMERTREAPFTLISCIALSQIKPSWRIRTLCIYSTRPPDHRASVF